jgi:DNA (cytosine-5)-methyltransferase 1
MKKIKVGTDFSGIGAPEQALKNLGYDFENVFFCEIDKHAARSYQAIHEAKTYFEDITKRDHAEVEPLDLYVAGFPCQSFSIAGKRKGWSTDENGQPVDKRGTLFFDVAKFIQINQPKVFILENVKGLISHEGGKTYQTIIDILTNGGGTFNGQMSLDVFDDGLGYHVYAQVLNSKHHGVPQNRERIFIVGFKDFRPFSFPKKEPLKKRLKDVLEAEVNEKHYLSEKTVQKLIKNNIKPNKDICETAIDAHYYKGFGIRGNKGRCTVQGLKVKSATKDGYEIAQEGDSINFKNPNSETRLVRVGKQISQTIEVNNQVGVFIGDYRTDEGLRVRKNNCAPCLTASKTSKKDPSRMPGLVGNNHRIRRLTPLECWRLQDFPDEAFFKAQAVNSDTQLYKQAGNSITVRVIQKIIERIYEA